MDSGESIFNSAVVSYMNQVCVDMCARLSSKFRHVHHGINRIDSTHNSGAEVTTSCRNVFPTEKWRTFSNEVSWSLETFGAEYDCLRVEWTEAVSAQEMPSWDVLDLPPHSWRAASLMGCSSSRFCLIACFAFSWVWWSTIRAIVNVELDVCWA